MKYLLTLVLLLGVWADDYESQYGSLGHLKKYGGIYYDGYDGVEKGYGNDGKEYRSDEKEYANDGKGYSNVRQGYGQAGQIFGRRRGQQRLGGEIVSSGNLGLSAGLGLQAGLSAGAGLASNLGGAIGIGLNANLNANLNLEANLGLSNEEDLVRPCNLDDWQCIRKFFSSNSQCSPSYGPVPDPLFLAQSTLYIPFINLNLLQTNVRISGMGSASIRDFYVNRITGNLVISLNVQNLNETSPRCYARYQRQGRESITLVDFSAIAFSQLSLTVVIPRLPNLRLDLAEIHADFQDENPKFDFGPSILNSSNSLVLSANARLSANLQAVVRESFLFQAQLLAAIYIQQNICDFGVKLSSY